MSSHYLTTMLLLVLISIFVPQEAIADEHGYLWLVNKEHPLDSSFKPSNLTEYKGIKLDASAHAAFVEMLKAMEADGIGGLHLQSAYRPYSYQRAIFDQKVSELTRTNYSKNEATHIASQSIQYPGASEHQTGLALDVSINGRLDQSFADTNAGRWLSENSHHFGFIIRYPQFKTAITNIIYEPWHLRYVGTPHASAMKNLDLTLEEYWHYLKQVKMYIIWGEGTDYHLIIYANAPPDIIPCGMVDISSSKPGEGARYIITLNKQYPVVW